jgi:nucleoside-diphosphate-sugar epimerase
VRDDIMTSPENTRWAEASLALALAFRAHGGVRAAFLGTSAEYDWSGSGPLRAGVSTLMPATPYGAAKHALRLALEAEASPAGLSLVWPRIFFVYGPHEHSSRLGMTVLQSLLADRPVDLSEGHQVRDYVYVDDVGEGVASALLSDFEGATDLASGVPTTVRQLAGEIGRQLGKAHLLKFGARPTAPHETPMVLGDGAHARAHIGWSARTTLEQGVSKFIAWGRTNLRS